MAKEFKDFDKKYAEFAGKIFEAWIDDIDKRTILYSDLKDITNWKYAMNIRYWSNAEIRYAVYEAKQIENSDYETAEDWQKYRVSLKGLSTEQKLYRLARRYEHFIQSGNFSAMCMNIERIRIDNYIGALVRGGQLNTKKEVVR